ncbi:hypothetical protein ACI3RH_13650, partial [Lactococcus lactis]
MQSADVQLMFDCIPVSFVDKLNQLLEKTNLSAEKIQVITSPQVPITYPFIIQLKIWKLALKTYRMKLTDEQFDYQQIATRDYDLQQDPLIQVHNFQVIH